MRKEGIILILFLVVFFMGDVFAQGPGWEVWVDDVMTKYRQNGEDGTTGLGVHTIKMARNEFEPFQVLIYADGASLNNVDVIVDNFTDGSGNTIEQIYIYKQHYFDVTTKSREEYETGSWPDALLPKVDRYYGEARSTFPFDVENNKVQGVWIDVGTKQDTVPGVYTSTVHVTADGKSEGTLNITLVVWDFEIPSTSTILSFIGLEDSELRPGHGLDDKWNPIAIAPLKKLYTKALLYNRVSVTPSSGGWYTSTDANNQVNDWSLYDSVYGSMMDGTEITSGTYAGAGIRSASIELCNTWNSNWDPDESTFMNYLQSWYDKFESEGWNPLDRLYCYSIDEPNWQTIGQRYSTNYRGDPNIYQYEIASAKAQALAKVNPEWKNAFVTEERKTYGKVYEIRGNDDKIRIDINDDITGTGVWPVGAFDGENYYLGFKTGSAAGNRYKILGNEDYRTFTIDTNLTNEGVVVGDEFVIDPTLIQSNDYMNFDDTGIYCPTIMKYTYHDPSWQLPIQKVPRDIYPHEPGDVENWMKRDHISYLACDQHECWSVGGTHLNNLPDLSLETSPRLTRTIGWLWWYYRAHGFLYYMSNICYEEGAYDINCIHNFGGNGDGTLFYPGVPTSSGRILPATTPVIGGTNDIPVDSIRLRLIREAMEDREYLELLRSLGAMTEADQYVGLVFTSTDDSDGSGCPLYCTQTNGSVIMTARENAASKIIELSGGVSTCSPADTNSNSIIEIGELLTYISDWKAGSVSIGDLLTAIGEWKNGC